MPAAERLQRHQTSCPRSRSQRRGDAVSEPKANILVVDDDVAFTYAAYRFFERRGYHVKTANGSKEAFEMLKRNAFDIVVTDIKLGRHHYRGEWKHQGEVGRRRDELL